jgi:NAD+ synthetase
MIPISLSLAQLNPIVGDLSGNAQKILDAYRHGVSGGASIVVCPELCLTGYPPEDLVLMPAFRAQAMLAARQIIAATSEAGLVFGTLWEEGGAVYNAAVFASHGRIRHIHFKTMLPNEGVFDEKRIFSAGDAVQVFEWNGQRLVLLVCEDVWHPHVVQALEGQKLDMVLVINASPFETGKAAQRQQIVADVARVLHTQVVYMNMVGGQDDLVFDGGSFVMNAQGYLVTQAPCFAEALHRVEMAAHDTPPVVSEEESIWNAMRLGLADYVRKNGFQGVLLGLSGGIDSALTAALAVDALGAEHVRGVLLPSPYTSQDSIDDALETAQLLGIHTDTIAIAPMMEAARQTLNPLMTHDWMEDLAVGGNLQARIRGQILMALSNKTGFMLLSTGNKSEIAVGYTTLYGDSCGGYNVLKDVYKTQVYALAHWRNAQSQMIPHRSITKAPTAELKPGQKDSDQLPEYEVLDAILALHLEGKKSADDITSMGYDAETVKRVLHLVRINEYKRRQSCPGVKISSMMFGRDRRYPLTNRFPSASE